MAGLPVMPSFGVVWPWPALPLVRDPNKRYNGLPIVGFREPWLEKIELGEKTADGRRKAVQVTSLASGAYPSARMKSKSASRSSTVTVN